MRKSARLRFRSEELRCTSQLRKQISSCPTPWVPFLLLSSRKTMRDCSSGWIAALAPGPLQMDCWIGKCADRIILKDGQSSPHEQLTEKGTSFASPFAVKKKFTTGAQMINWQALI